MANRGLQGARYVVIGKVVNHPPTPQTLQRLGGPTYVVIFISTELY